MLSVALPSSFTLESQHSDFIVSAYTVGETDLENDCRLTVERKVD